MAERLTVPFTDEVARGLKAGQQVLLGGRILAARDAAHRRLYDLIVNGETLPVNLQGQVVYYVGPTPARPGMATGSAGPTTSGRMDAYTPRLLEQGLKGMIGKGYRSEAVKKAIRQYGAPYLVATGGAGALLATHIRGYRVIAWPELGPEALAEMVIEDFPAIVAYDASGNDFYEIGQAPYRETR